MRINDAVTGVVLALFALAVIGYARTFPAMPGQDYGPALFPTLISIGLIAAGLILILSGLSRWRAGEPLISGGEWLRSRSHVASFLAVIGGLLLYILISDRLGFILTALPLLFGWLVLFRGGKPVSSLVIALAVTFVVNYAFSQLLLVPLPLGLLQPLIY
ncbi:MAG: tripartite tricarboxylate transporter TctB family protein [Burkholderiales bacterium]|nr:tripartite tricarboxylate transporter TctB family protein [Burkholderiales bacterium]